MSNYIAGRSVVLLLCAGLLSALAACDSSREEPDEARTTDGAGATVSPAAPTPDRSSAASVDPPLTIAPTDRVIVAPMSGSGSAKTVRFPIKFEKFTAKIACLDEGSIAVSSEGQAIEVPCDGNPRRIHVATDSPKGQVAISADGTQKWSIAVVVTDDFATVGPTAATLPA